MNYIINTGCSYGVMFRSMKEFTDGNDTDFYVIDLHCDSHGSTYQKRSVIYTVSKLLKSGITPNNIYVITEWSQPNRLFTELPIEFCEEIFTDYNHAEKTFILDNKLNRVEDDFDFDFVRKYKSLSVIFGDSVYTNPDTDDFTYFDNRDIQWYLTQHQLNNHISHKPIDRFENYLTDILDLQNFLKSKNIDYSFFLMNNTFEGYVDDVLHRYTDGEMYDELSKDTIIIPDLTNDKLIKDFSSYLNSVWGLIDFSHFHFYKTERFNYGGIDEYSMEKFGHIAYTSCANPWDIPDDGYVTSFGAHPHDSVYIDFFIEFVYDKVKPYIGELEFDFTDRWSKSKHNAIRL